MQLWDPDDWLVGPPRVRTGISLIRYRTFSIRSITRKDMISFRGVSVPDPGRPHDQPARSACGKCALCESASTARAAPSGISVESCQQLAQATRCLARLRGQPRVWQKPTTSAHVPHVYRSSCYDVWINLEHAVACIPTIS